MGIRYGSPFDEKKLGSTYPVRVNCKATRPPSFLKDNPEKNDCTISCWLLRLATRQGEGQNWAGPRMVAGTHKLSPHSDPMTLAAYWLQKQTAKNRWQYSDDSGPEKLSRTHFARWLVYMSGWIVSVSDSLPPMMTMRFPGR